MEEREYRKKRRLKDPEEELYTEDLPTYREVYEVVFFRVPELEKRIEYLEEIIKELQDESKST